MAAAKLSRQNSKFSQLRLSSSPSLSLSRSRSPMGTFPCCYVPMFAKVPNCSLVALFPCLQKFPKVPLFLCSHVCKSSQLFPCCSLPKFANVPNCSLVVLFPCLQTFPILSHVDSFSWLFPWNCFLFLGN